jgi:hypothetical protein
MWLAPGVAERRIPMARYHSGDGWSGNTTIDDVPKQYKVTYRARQPTPATSPDAICGFAISANARHVSRTPRVFLSGSAADRMT